MIESDDVSAMLRIAGGQVYDDILVILVLSDVHGFEERLVPDPRVDKGDTLQNLRHVLVHFGHKLRTQPEGLLFLSSCLLKYHEIMSVTEKIGKMEKIVCTKYTFLTM